MTKDELMNDDREYVIRVYVDGCYEPVNPGGVL